MDEPDPQPAPPIVAAPALRRDLDDGLRFAHVLAMQTKRDVTELASRFFALLEEMASRGQLDLPKYDERRALRLEQEEQRAASRAHVQIAPVPDKYALTDLPDIDCAARIPLCRARCCTLTFPLSFQDLDERVVQWEYGRPYQIRRRSDGSCTHCAPDTRQCGVYAQRPAACRIFDCRQDSRIWLDFERRIPAPEPDPARVAAEPSR
ncbi:MAG: YkgJ family cysteine cluster protein [Myxococcales bacterium]|nr:YkgJ family cysteine cluster protein [Myxococcales bacterium]